MYKITYRNIRGQAVTCIVDTIEEFYLKYDGRIITIEIVTQ